MIRKKPAPALDAGVVAGFAIRSCATKFMFVRETCLSWPQLMHGCGNAGAFAQRVFEVDRTAVFFQQIAECLVGHFMKVFHLVVAEEIELPPGLLIELHPFARHALDP